MPTQNEKPIIFSSPMIPAILDGRKTQTRRVIKIPDKDSDYYNIRTGKGWVDPGLGGGAYLKVEYQHQGETFYDEIVNRIYCPHGQIGDHLWVRENFAYITDPFAVTISIRYQADGTEKHFPDGSGAHISDGRTVYNHCGKNYPGCIKYRPSIHMPRWASRITLEITDVRVERVQDISEEDAKAEGVESCNNLGFCYRDYQLKTLEPLATARLSFKSLWDSINALRGYGWSTNLWVWTISFRRLTPADILR